MNARVNVQLDFEQPGVLIRWCRQSRFLEQKELADKLRMQQSEISEIERGRRIPTAITLFKLLNACGYILDIIPAYEEDENENDQTGEAGVSSTGEDHAGQADS